MELIVDKNLDMKDIDFGSQLFELPPSYCEIVAIINTLLLLIEVTFKDTRMGTFVKMNKIQQC